MEFHLHRIKCHLGDSDSEFISVSLAFQTDACLPSCECLINISHFTLAVRYLPLVMCSLCPRLGSHLCNLFWKCLLANMAVTLPRSTAMALSFLCALCTVLIISHLISFINTCLLQISTVLLFKISATPNLSFPSSLSSSAPWVIIHPKYLCHICQLSASGSFNFCLPFEMF